MSRAPDNSVWEGANFEEAERLCLLELVERHAMYTPHRPLLQSTMAAMESQYRILHPDDILHYVVDFVPGSRHPFDPRAEVCWVGGMDLRKGNELWLPAQLAYLTVEGESAWALETSNGVALGATDAEAQLFALAELVERDAFMTFWFGRRTPRKVDIASLPSDAHLRITEMTDHGNEVHVLDLSVLPGLAVIMVVVLGRNSTVATFQSTAAHPDPVKALHNALDEALVGFRVYERNPEIPGLALQPEEVTDLNDHIRWAAHRRQEHIYDWALAEADSVDFDHVTGSVVIPSCASALSARELLDGLLSDPLADLNFIGVNLSTPLSESIGCRVWRVISPDVSPMWFGFQHRRVNERALRTRLRAAGYNGSLSEGQEVPIVHPYA
ncbi:YcaO-like family protein [Arcanobacterium hippocoleae]